MLFLFKSTPENKKRKHSEHFLHHQEPMGSQRADRTYCTSHMLIHTSKHMSEHDQITVENLNIYHFDNITRITSVNENNLESQEKY